MNPRFETINGNLYMMLEKPIPLTKDAKFPCVVRLIQDDSPMGRYNNRLTDKCLLPFICVGIDNNGDMERMENAPRFSHECYELLGYPVAEGSAEWAVWQMMHGKQIVLGNGSVKHDHIRSIKDNAVFCSACGQLTLDINDWLLSAEISGWQLYEPKPLLADAKVGDLVTNRAGYISKIKYIDNNKGVLKYAYEVSDGTTIYVRENGMFNIIDHNSNYDIIHTEPLAQEGSAEWAWQMWCLLGKIVVLKGYKASVKDSWGVCPQTSLFRGNDVNYWRKHKGEWLLAARAYQWQLYEPEQPFAKVKVGDWVEHLNGNQLRIVEIKEPACLTSPHVKDRNKCFKCDNGNTYSVVDGCCITVGDKILAILKPSEVRVKITLEGTVRNSINDCCFDLSTPNGGWATIGYNEIDPATADLVRELIAKQEEEE
jgi:hypothetical protein